MSDRDIRKWVPWGRLQAKASKCLSIHQVLVERSLKGSVPAEQRTVLGSSGVLRLGQPADLAGLESGLR